jgi:hypothetical protein
MHDGACRFERIDDRRILRRQRPVLVDQRPLGDAPTLAVVLVLDANRDPFERPFGTFLVPLLRRLGLAHRLVEMLVGDGIDQRVVFLDALDLGLQQVDR